MDIDTFFEEANARSLVKARLVAGYFGVWSAAVLAAQARSTSALAYFELCAGPGRYDDGTESTPLLVLRQALEWPLLADSLVTVFNDFDAEYISALKEAIDNLPGSDRLRHRPLLFSQELDLEWLDQLACLMPMPSLVFADPWGFKTFRAELFGRLLREWQSELIFMFNYNRINLGLGDPAREAVLAEIFGPGLLRRLLADLPRLSPDHRERAVLDCLAARLGNLGGPFVLPFRICRLDGRRTSYYVVYASRSSLGYALMRGVMAKQSTSDSEYEYGPADKAWRMPDYGLRLEPVFLEQRPTGRVLSTDR